MIKASKTIISKSSYVKAEGTDIELLEDLTRIVNALIDKGGLTEEMIDIAVQIGKAMSKGNEKETVEKIKTQILKEKLKEKAYLIDVDLKELMKQAKEMEEEANED